MTQRERIDDHNAEVYDAPTRTQPVRQTVTHNAPDYNVDVVTPTDRVRWGPVIAGLFAALSTLAAMTLLGLALGTALFDPNDQASTYGIGAGIWAALSALVAFFVGGWLAARTSALRGRSAGILNGAMVWFVAIPLLLYGLTSGIGAIGRTLGNVAGTVAQTGAAAAGAAGEDAAAAAQNPDVQQQAGQAADQVQQQAQQLGQTLQDPQTQEEIANTVSANAWRTLLSLGVAAAAAILGGMAGSGRKDEIDQRITA